MTFRRQSLEFAWGSTNSFGDKMGSTSRLQLHRVQETLPCILLAEFDEKDESTTGNILLYTWPDTLRSSR